MTGLAAIFNGTETGRTVLLRADIDALPIAETNTFGHRSKNSGISHKCVDIICNVASEKGFSINEIGKPFRWSEDFGHFTQKFRGALFGIGAGTNAPDLHQPEYDFNDEMIETGIEIFDGIIRKLLQ